MDSLRRDLEDVAAAIRAEIRLEAEEAEREAAVSAAMRRSLADVAREVMAHGDTVAVSAGREHFVGVITGVGAEVLTLAGDGARVDIHLACLVQLRVVQRARAGGVRGQPDQAVTLRARLLELQLGGGRVEFGVDGQEEPVLGPVALVGADHVAIGPEVWPEWFLPFRALTYLRTANPASR